MGTQTVVVWESALACHYFYTSLQAFKQLLETERIMADNTDVRDYEVDGITYLARTVVVSF